MRSNTKLQVAALAACCGLAAPALAEIPAALGHISPDAGIVISIRNLAEAQNDLSTLVATVPGANAPELAMAGAVLQTPGVNAQGSAAIVILPNAEGKIDMEGGEPNAAIIVPVSDYAAFVGNFGGNAEGISSIDFDGQEVFAKRLNDGFALLANSAVTAEGYGAGVGIEHVEQMLRGGAETAGSNDIMLMTNMELFRADLNAQLEQFKPQIDFFAGMAGAQAGADAEQLKQQALQMFAVAENWVNQSEIAYLGLDISADGVALDIASTFTEGSEIAGFFQGAGNAMELLGRTPAVPFFMAGSVDYSNVGMKQLFMNANEMQAGGGLPGIQELQTNITKNSSGTSFVFGATPNLLGDLFGASSLFYHAEDGAKLKQLNEKGVTDLDGANSQGMTISSSYEAGVADINGVSVDKWGLKFAPEAGTPGAMQMQQAMGMMFGAQGGPGGFVASIDDGVVVTMGQNQGNFNKALSAAAGDADGMNTNADVQSAAAHLPEDAFFVGFLGIGELAKAAQGMMAMMGGGPDINLDGDIPPLAAAAAATEGDFRVRIFAPTALITKAAEIAAEAQAMQEGGGGGSPRF